MKRKPAASFSADVQGYSRLMGEDEAATIRTLTTYREVMTTLIQQHRGRVVDSPGDNLLAEFASAVDAVQGALAIQRALRARNAELPDNRKMAYRIGINVGDVVVEGERIYGDEVNIAARLESLAEGGGLCLSGTVYDQCDAPPEPMPRGSAPGPSGAGAGRRCPTRPACRVVGNRPPGGGADQGRRGGGPAAGAGGVARTRLVAGPWGRGTCLARQERSRRRRRRAWETLAGLTATGMGRRWPAVALTLGKRPHGAMGGPRTHPDVILSTCLTKISGQGPNGATHEYPIRLGWYILTATCTEDLPLLKVSLCISNDAMRRRTRGATWLS